MTALNQNTTVDPAVLEFVTSWPRSALALTQTQELEIKYESKGTNGKTH